MLKKFCQKVIGFAVLAVFALIILWIIFDSDEYKESASEKREEELAEAEAECTNKGMYPYRADCTDVLNSTCHVVCWPEPQKGEE